jgi:hypothetical protein
MNPERFAGRVGRLACCRIGGAAAPARGSLGTKLIVMLLLRDTSLENTGTKVVEEGTHGDCWTRPSVLFVEKQDLVCIKALWVSSQARTNKNWAPRHGCGRDDAFRWRLIDDGQCLPKERGDVGLESE